MPSEESETEKGKDELDEAEKETETVTPLMEQVDDVPRTPGLLYDPSIPDYLREDIHMNISEST